VLLDSLAERPAPHRRGSPRRAARNDHDVHAMRLLPTSYFRRADDKIHYG
jgi:hypothetical protein